MFKAKLITTAMGSFHVTYHAKPVDPTSLLRGMFDYSKRGEKSMGVRKLPGTPTVGGLLFWKYIATIDGWRIQYNKTLDKASPLNPYRLLGPD
ncbi:MAG: hypothetical protein JJU11_13420, partial [Candidatus Sumerlaeia bacterium]|nr:hypothetical protein [Candidatus Sumerlaeia bacterium]